jgi:predicted MPP superfamily phosphohydrolase
MRGWQAIPQQLILKLTYCILFLVLSSSFIIAMLFRDTLSLGVLKIFYVIGTTWLACMLYFTFFFLFTDLIYLANKFIHFLPDSIVLNYRQIQVILCFIFIAVALIIGNYRFNNPVIDTYELKIAKKAGNRKELRIVAISDIHLGLSIDKGKLKKYVAKINDLKPDVILIGGDLIDNSIRPLNEEHLENELNKMDASLGIYACLGNHEYISGVEKSLAFFSKTKINVLIDQAVCVDSSFWVIGRDDRSNLRRHFIEDLVKKIDLSLPILLLDHQPYYLDEAQRNGIDFQFSGHTHNGQIWPGNLIVKKVYELGYGYKLKGKTHVYVSSGLGLWGPMFRIGSKSEIVVFNIYFE